MLWLWIVLGLRIMLSGWVRLGLGLPVRVRVLRIGLGLELGLRLGLGFKLGLVFKLEFEHESYTWLMILYVAIMKHSKIQSYQINNENYVNSPILSMFS